MNKKTKKIGALALGALVAFGAGAGLAKVSMEPEEVTRTIFQEKIVEVPVEGPIQYVTETVYEEKEVQVEVLVEPEELVQYIIDESGDLSALDLDEIEDYGYDELIAQIDFIQQAKLMAADYVKKEAKDELDKYDFNATIKFDEDDIDRVRVDDDLDELVISDIDFEDGDADVRVRVRFEHDDVDYEAYFDVEIKDFSVDDITLDTVSLQ